MVPQPFALLLLINMKIIFSFHWTKDIANIFHVDYILDFNVHTADYI
jgi:hypothetical protein